MWINAKKKKKNRYNLFSCYDMKLVSISTLIFLISVFHYAIWNDLRYFQPHLTLLKCDKLVIEKKLILNFMKLKNVTSKQELRRKKEIFNY